MAEKSSDVQQSSGTSQQAQGQKGAAQQAGSQARQAAGQSSSQSASRERSSQQQGSRASTALQRRSSAPMVGAFGLSPFSLMRRMMEDLDRFFEGFGSGRGFDLGSFSGPELRGLSVWSPPIEALERDGNFVIRADLPGLSPDDVRIEAADDSILVEGERRSETESEERGGVYRSERVYGRFSRVIPLPTGADAQKAQARFENGVLEITIPIEEAKSGRRRIEIQGGSGGAKQRTGEPSVH